MTVIREPAVAGQFYPGTASELSTTIRVYLDEAEVQQGPAPKALIVPHAGYVYSGPVAASAYARLRPYRQHYTRVILLGPCHRVAVQGLALSGADVFRTPLGDVPLDKDAIANLELPDVKVFDATHQFEHSLEVHLPFLQSVIESFSLVPLVVGHVPPETVARVIDALWGGPETLIVISSDLSHYLTYDEARASDKTTCEAIENLQAQSIDHDKACGATLIGGLLIATKRRGMRVITLDLRNSGDTAGDKSHVVGYGSWMFLENDRI
ncbi:MAG: AmmeMemoRadiSam system protein B [Gammaproteobacteria bacterium]|nr:AmmeMemoRadiSam system protein B [Gammaproteobacteria bacterium]